MVVRAGRSRRPSAARDAPHTRADGCVDCACPRRAPPAPARPRGNISQSARRSCPRQAPACPRLGAAGGAAQRLPPAARAGGGTGCRRRRGWRKRRCTSSHTLRGERCVPARVPRAVGLQRRGTAPDAASAWSHSAASALGLSLCAAGRAASLPAAAAAAVSHAAAPVHVFSPAAAARALSAARQLVMRGARGVPPDVCGRCSARAAPARPESPCRSARRAALGVRPR